MASQTQPLKKIALITRPREDSKRIAPDFLNRGYDVLISPILEIKHYDITLPSYDIICLSSKNALPALKTTSKYKPIYCIGKHTAKEIQALGFSKITSAPTAKDLLKILKITEQHNSIVYLSGTTTTLDFSKKIPRCTKIICYDAIPQTSFSKLALESLLKGHITHLPLYSIESAKLLHQLLIKNKIDLKCIKLVVLSEKIARSIEHFDFKEILVADNPTHQSLINLL